jgi:hypothetical protein
VKNDAAEKRRRFFLFYVFSPSLKNERQDIREKEPGENLLFLLMLTFLF